MKNTCAVYPGTVGTEWWHVGPSALPEIVHVSAPVHRSIQCSNAAFSCRPFCPPPFHWFAAHSHVNITNPTVMWILNTEYPRSEPLQQWCTQDFIWGWSRSHSHYIYTQLRTCRTCCSISLRYNAWQCGGY